jgi:ABC-type glycerol-3-phosphate transport system substrate-binding protein
MKEASLKLRLLAFGLIVGATVLVATGCGGGGHKESEGGASACRAAATSAATGFPAGFPKPGELTITAAHRDGPTRVIEGYWASGLDEAYNEYKDQVDEAGYTVLFTEKEEHDAEISYKGEGRSGQIALRDDCSESDTTRVHITSRPA